MKMKMLLGGLAAALLLVGCSNNAATPAEKAEVKPMVSEEKLGLRKTDLYTEETTVANKTQYGTDAPGTSKRIERAFDNAPPMIPHDVEGMLPITANNNACIGCHAPEVAPAMMATPIPGSHFASFRPKTKIASDGSVVKEGKAIVNTSDIKVVVHKLDELSQARFNCSQCHAPQSTGDVLVQNNFRPDYQGEEMKRRSNLLDTLNAGVE